MKTEGPNQITGANAGGPRQLPSALPLGRPRRSVLSFGRRMKARFTSLPEGFSGRSQGRSGFVYFRRQEKVLELYWEISGVADYDWLVSLEATKVWADPKGEQVPEVERQEIVEALESWLVSQKIRTDAFGPIKRSVSPRKK
jgi:hypothetical protein